MSDAIKLIAFLRQLRDLFNQGDQWAGFSNDDKLTLVVIKAVGVSLDDIRKWLPVVLKHIGTLAPIILDGIAAGKKPLAIFLECIGALSLSGVTA